MEFIHGGKNGSVFGAWDYIVATASDEMMKQFIIHYKKGCYLRSLLAVAFGTYQCSNENIKRSLAVKYSYFLSRQKYQLICKTKESVFDPNKEVWVPKNVEVEGVPVSAIRMSSYRSLEKFVKDLNIVSVSLVPGHVGVTRTISETVFMIVDLHVRCPYLYKKLNWFNDCQDHFVFQFSDDGAPEASDVSMSTGSLTFWNFVNRVHSCEYHYYLHALSTGEKDAIMENLWRQHTSEMQVLQGNVYKVAGKEIILEFEPGADQSWQAWANNELNNAATNPSPYANVSKISINTMGGTIGMDSNDTWRPPMEQRTKDLASLEKFKKSLGKNLAESTRHSNDLSFMAENNFRQVGEPRIGVFVDRQKPDTLHTEINAWQHALNLIYLEVIYQGLF